VVDTDTEGDPLDAVLDGVCGERDAESDALTLAVAHE